MTLRASLTAPSRNRTRPCEFNRWMSSLDPEDADAVREALYRDENDSLYLNVPELWRRIGEGPQGYSGSQATVYKHRRNGCTTCRI